MFIKKKCVPLRYNLKKEVPLTCRFARSTTYQQAQVLQPIIVGCYLWLCIGLWRSLQVDTETVHFFYVQ